MKKITLLFLICFTPFVNAEPISFLNKVIGSEPITFLKLNWSMSLNRMFYTMKKYGVHCEEHYSGRYYDCDPIDLWINTDDDDPYIKFNCESYKGCTTDVRTMAGLIEKKYGIEMYKEVLLVSGSTEIQYCGTGSEGDRICVIDDKWGQHVELYKGTLGGPKPSF